MPDDDDGGDDDDDDDDDVRIWVQDCKDLSLAQQLQSIVRA